MHGQDMQEIKAKGAGSMAHCCSVRQGLGAITRAPLVIDIRPASAVGSGFVCAESLVPQQPRVSLTSSHPLLSLASSPTPSSTQDPRAISLPLPFAVPCSSATPVSCCPMQEEAHEEQDRGIKRVLSGIVTGATHIATDAAKHPDERNRRRGDRGIQRASTTTSKVRLPASRIWKDGKWQVYFYKICCEKDSDVTEYKCAQISLQLLKLLFYFWYDLEKKSSETYGAPSKGAGKHHSPSLCSSAFSFPASSFSSCPSSSSSRRDGTVDSDTTHSTCNFFNYDALHCAGCRSHFAGWWWCG